jgi:NADH-quinone oxidoreductase subunit L
MHPTTEESWIGLTEGGAISLVGIATAWLLYIKRPDLPGKFRERFKWIHTLTVNKWFGDEIVDFLIVNPVKAFGRFCNGIFERGVINGATAGVAGLTRSAGAAVRDIQTGMLRGYAVLMLFGILAIVVYFLIRSI